MGYHLGVCPNNPKNKKNTDSLCQTTLASTNTLGPEVRALETRHAIVAWIARNNHSFSVVDQPGVSCAGLFERSGLSERSVLPKLIVFIYDISQRDVHSIVPGDERSPPGEANGRQRPQTRS